MDEWIDEWMVGWTAGWLQGFMDGQMERGRERGMGGWMIVSMPVCTAGWVGRWMRGWRDGELAVYMYDYMVGWMGKGRAQLALLQVLKLMLSSTFPSPNLPSLWLLAPRTPPILSTPLCQKGFLGLLRDPGLRHICAEPQLQRGCWEGVRWANQWAQC